MCQMERKAKKNTMMPFKKILVGKVLFECVLIKQTNI